MGFLNDIVNGKEKKIKADPLAGTINAIGSSGLSMLKSGGDELNNKIYNNADNYVGNQIDLENKLLRTASDDAAKRTRQLIAQRGMGMSSIGLGQEVNNQKQLNEKIAMNNASGMDRLKGLLNEKMQTGMQMFNPKASQGPIQMTDTTYRTGGYGQLIGAGLQAGATLGSAYIKNKKEEEK